MALAQDELEQIIDVARDYLHGAVSDDDLRSWGSAPDFAAALVQISSACVVGLPCGRHSGAVHGSEAEELRKGIEKILVDYPEEPEDGRHTYYDQREALRRLVDEIDARDSLAALSGAEKGAIGG